MNNRLSIDTIFRHEYGEGKKYKSSPRQRYFERDDECTLCGLKKNIIEFDREGIHHVITVSYSRSGQAFPHDHEPDCWGEKNIK